jgi:hypothetical protein
MLLIETILNWLLCMVRIVWGKDQMPIYLCAWYVFKAWCVHSIEKIKDNGVWHAILDDFHNVMYTTIESSESIETFMTRGRNKVMKTSPNICLVIHGFNTFGPIIFKLVRELTLNPLLLFHHVVHISKYGLLELRWKHQWWTWQSHVGIMYLVVDLWIVGLQRVPPSN